MVYLEASGKFNMGVVEREIRNPAKELFMKTQKRRQISGVVEFGLYARIANKIDPQLSTELRRYLYSKLETPLVNQIQKLLVKEL